VDRFVNNVKHFLRGVTSGPRGQDGDYL